MIISTEFEKKSNFMKNILEDKNRLKIKMYYRIKKYYKITYMEIFQIFFKYGNTRLSTNNCTKH